MLILVCDIVIEPVPVLVFLVSRNSVMGAKAGLENGSSEAGSWS